MWRAEGQDLEQGVVRIEGPGSAWISRSGSRVWDPQDVKLQGAGFEKGSRIGGTSAMRLRLVGTR